MPNIDAEHVAKRGPRKCEGQLKESGRPRMGVVTAAGPPAAGSKPGGSGPTTRSIQFWVFLPPDEMTI